MATASNGSEREYELVESLLSKRFAYPLRKATMNMSALQQRRMAEFVGLLREGRYRMVSEPCPCGVSSKHYLLARVDRYGLPLDSVLCSHCGTVRIDPFLDAASLDSFYRELYQELYGRAVDLPHYFAAQGSYGRKIATWINPSGAAKPTRVLEVGCGAGGAISAFHELGLQIAGCDYDGKLLEYGSAKGIPNLLCGSVEAALKAFGDHAFDFIYLHHVFEHVGAPLEMLQQMRQLLAPNGRILVIVPELENIDLFPNPQGDALRFFHVAHKFNFSCEGLSQLAFRGGFNAVRVAPPLQDTPWSSMPELWMQLTSNAGMSQSPGANAGERVLRRLQQTEANFLSAQKRLFWRHSWKQFRKQLRECAGIVRISRKAA